MSTGESEPSSASALGGSSTDLSNIQENINRQQAKISALKELVRKSEAAHGKSNSSAQEKVRNIAQRLSHIKLKARSRQNLNTSLSTSDLHDDAIQEESQTSISPTPPLSAHRAETPGSEKIQLLRRQVEESKLKMAERENSKREIEELVTQLKAKFDSTQQSLERSSELGRSMGDLSVLTAGTTKEKFKSATDLSFTPLNLDKEKIKFLENRIKLLEKQIEKHATIVSVSTTTTNPTNESELVTSLRNQILDLEENLREKECIIDARTQAVSLMTESLAAKGKTTVDTLEDTRQEMVKMQENFVESENELKTEIERLAIELEEKCQKILNLEEINDILETARFDLTVKNSELETKIQDVQEYSTKLDELNKLNGALQNKIDSLEEQLTEKTVECNVLNANFSVLQEKLKATAPKSLFSKSGDEEAEIEIKKLKEQLDEANKSMIKMKLKSKQLQKQVEKFKKISDANSELIRLTEENQEMQMKITELEDEKGSLQLKLLNSGAESEKLPASELEKKVQLLETTCQNQTSAIQLLEEQKIELQTTNAELESMKDQQTEKVETAAVASQIDALHLEEQVEDHAARITQLQDELEKLKTENISLHDDLHNLDEEKQELSKKVQHYLSENVELLDKVEKLSKSSSSAESIEIVEQLTHQEKLEMEAFNKKISATDVPQEAKHPIDEPQDNLMGQELSDSLIKLREESSELQHRIELFTTERREVLEKMEILSSENQELLRQIANLREDKSAVEDSLTKSKLELVTLEEKLDIALRDRTEIQTQLNETSDLKSKLETEINSMRSSVERSSSSISPTVSSPNPIDQCARSIAQLTTELENYRKSNDKSGRLNASKKLAKEAKNVCQQFDDLLVNIKVTKETSDSGEISELKNKCDEFQSAIAKLREELIDSRTSLVQKDDEIANLESKLSQASENFEKLRHEQTVEVGRLEQTRKELDAKLGVADDEINILKTLVSEQKQQLIDAFTEHEIELNAKINEIENYEKQVGKLKAELDSVKSEHSRSNDNFVSQLKKDVKKLENLLSENKKLIAEQTDDLRNKQATIESLNAQIIDLYKTMEDNVNKVAEKEDEIAYLQDLLDTNKADAERLTKENEENKKVIEKLLLELHENKSNAERADLLANLEEKNSQLQHTVKQLENTIGELEHKSKEHVEKLKKFAANLKKKTAQCAELESKLKNLSLTASEQPDMQNVIHALQQEIKQYQDQIQALQTTESSKFEQDAFEQEIGSLRIERDSNAENYRILAANYENLQSELTMYKTKVEFFERSIDEVQAIVDVLQGEVAAKENEITNLRSQLHAVQAEFEQRLATTADELRNKSLKFEKSKAVIKEKNREIQRLKEENVELEKTVVNLHSSPNVQAIDESPPTATDELAKLRIEYERLSESYQLERESFQQTIARLETLHDGIQAKFDENLSYIETLEADNINYKEKIIKLENCIAIFEERRLSMERQTDMLDAQLQKRTDEFERNEDTLIFRLNKLMDHDDIIGRRLVQAEEEREEIGDRFEQLKTENSELVQKLGKVEKELDAIRTEELEQLKAENWGLKDALENAQTELGRQQNVYEGRLSKKHSEIDDLENELSVQLNAINQEKRALQESLERSQDEVTELKDETVRMKESVNSLEQTRNDLEREITWIRMQNENLSQDQYDLQELRMQTMQDKTEIDNLKHQMDTLIQNHEIELNALRQQIKELDSVRMQVGQNQTDDQVFIETENKRLKEQLAEKEAAIESYQRENLKLQMASMMSDGGHGSAADPFSGAPQPAAIVQPTVGDNVELNLLREKVASLETALNEKDQQYNTTLQDAQSAREQLISLQQEISLLRPRSAVSEVVPPPPSHFFANVSQEPSLVFEELVAAQHVDSLGHGQTDQKKIEDLERNVSDLEKYANELESKLKNLTGVHESTLLQLQEQVRRYDETVRQYEERIKELESKHRELEIQKSIESMIVTTDTDVESLPSLNKFFTATPAATEFERLIIDPASDQADAPVPVEEPIIVPKKAYLLHPETETIELGNEEGWGWGSEEAALEERHQQQQLAQSQPSVGEYKNRIDELALERDRANEKIIEFQVKCGKLMKKLKEYKTKVDNLESEKTFRKSTSVDSNELDLAIQEELKSQVKKLEEQVGEMQKQHEKTIAEKENLTKRVDVLTLANERMTEMKERQDIEVKSLESKVRQLSQQLKQLEDWSDRSENQSKESPAVVTSSSSGQVAELKDKLQTALQEADDVRIDRDELQALLDDEKNNVRLYENKIEELREKIASLETVNQSDRNTEGKFHEVETELSQKTQLIERLQLQVNDYQTAIEQLSDESNSIRDQLMQIQANYDEKLTENAQLAEDLKLSMTKSEACSKEIELLKSKSETDELNSAAEAKIQELLSQLQYKEAEILHLKQKIQDLMQEDQTQSLVQEILSKNQEIVQLRMQVQQLESEKTELENNLSIQITKEMSQKTSSLNESEERLKRLEKELHELKEEKQNMETELQVLNNHIMSNLDMEERMKQTVLELDTKNIEIVELRHSLETLRQQQPPPQPPQLAVIDTPKETIDINRINREWEQRVEEKCSEIAESWRQYMEQRENEFRETESSLNLEIEQVRAGIVVPPRKTAEEIELETQSSTIPADRETMEKMQSALETQELEIVTLKEQLAIRSAEYARLASKHDPYALSTSSNLSYEPTPRKLSSISSDTTTATGAIDQTTVVPKSKLDLALYMLHERDMRCEELTLELVNLLEERDTLQLKLSNSLRQIEEIKQKTSYLESGSESEQPSSNPTTPEKSAKSRTSMEATDLQTDDLSSKISQLQSVKYAKDKNSRDEREQRQRQMEKIQQDIGDIPSETVASELVGIDFSNTMQNPSLLDWLWGKNKNEGSQS